MSDKNANVFQKRVRFARSEHAMRLRKKYSDQYEEAKKWRL